MDSARTSLNFQDNSNIWPCQVPLKSWAKRLRKNKSTDRMRTKVTNTIRHKISEQKSLKKKIKTKFQACFSFLITKILPKCDFFQLANFNRNQIYSI